MVIVTDPRNLSTRVVFEVSRDITEASPWTYWAPPVLPTSRREKKRLIVETVETGKDEVPGNAHDDQSEANAIGKKQKQRSGQFQSRQDE